MYIPESGNALWILIFLQVFDVVGFVTDQDVWLCHLFGIDQAERIILNFGKSTRFLSTIPILHRTPQSKITPYTNRWSRGEACGSHRKDVAMAIVCQSLSKLSERDLQHSSRMANS